MIQLLVAVVVAYVPEVNQKQDLFSAPKSCLTGRVCPL